MKCFYHKSDLDGQCSGAIVKKKYPGCEMIGVNYNDKLDLSIIEAGEPVFVVDFCFSADEMLDLYGKAGIVFWIDHHVSAIEKMKVLDNTFPGYREVGKAGCELTWEYLFSSTSMPKAVKLLGRYDVWDHKDLDVLLFQYGMREMDDTTPSSIIWDFLLDPKTDKDIINNAIYTGETIMSYEAKQNKMYAKGMAYENIFEGYRAIIINKAYSNSKIFDSVYDPEKHDIMVLFGVKPDEVKYTLFSDKPEIDVSKIAVKYGGGGHAGAAGFYLKEIIL